jgi:ethanolamine utilization protein EutN
MIAGKVIGSVVSTRKSERLMGNRFMVVEIVGSMKQESKQMITIDLIGAGIGEYVMIATGSAARIGCDNPEAPIDAAIVGLIDDGISTELLK